MKTLTTMILSAAVTLMGASGIYAQTTAAADIPFEFSVQGTTLPAGPYEMSKVGATRDLMIIRNRETKQAAAVIAPDGGQAGKTDEKNVVVFHQVGNRYFLADVKTAGVRGHLNPSKLERELSKEGAGQPLAAVILPALSVR